eukprot:1313829-Amphidinium_carterae.1
MSLIMCEVIIATSIVPWMCHLMCEVIITTSHVLSGLLLSGVQFASAPAPCMFHMCLVEDRTKRLQSLRKALPYPQDCNSCVPHRTGAAFMLLFPHLRKIQIPGPDGRLLALGSLRVNRKGGPCTEVQIESICTALSIRLVFVPVELEDPSLTLRYDLQQHFGNARHPRLHLLYWTRGDQGVHFDALLEVDRLSNLSYHDLQHLGGVCSLKLGRGEKAVLFRARLREKFGCGLSATGYNRLALPDYALVTLQEAPPHPIESNTNSGAASADGPSPSTRSARRRELQILSWNVCSIRSRATELSRLLEDRHFHVICLQEPGLPLTQDPPSLEGFKVACDLRKDTGKGGGLLVYVAQSLYVEVLELTCTPYAFACVLTVHWGRTPVKIGTMYWAPTTSCDADPMPLILDHLSAFSDHGVQLFVGDANAHWQAHDAFAHEDARGAAIEGFLNARGFLDYSFDACTRLHGPSRSVPDLLAMSPTVAEHVTCDLGPLSGSDHKPLFVSCQQKR